MTTTIENNVNFFRRDSTIGAAGIPQYENNDVGGELWLEIGLRKGNFKTGIRLDAFLNSNLLNPTDSYTASGLGKIYAQYSLGNADFEAGYIYDQYGSGIIFRSYESRPQLIDNALIGIKGTYHFSDNLFVSGMVGKQKQQFSVNEIDIRGLTMEGYYEIGTENILSFAPGVAYVNRRLTDSDVNGLVSVIRNYLPEEQVLPKYHSYTFSLFNALSYKRLQWYVETAYKFPEVFFDPNAIRTELTGRKVFGKYIKDKGTVFYSSLSLALDNLGITVEGKRTENFNFRASPLLRQNQGFISFIPPMSRQSTYRLLARYNPATQELSEMAWQIDIKNKISKQWSWHFNLSDIYTLEQELLFREYYFSLSKRVSRKYTVTGGIQLLSYNQAVYEVKPLNPLVKTVTPFLDILFNLPNRKTLRTEFQYMNADEDYGSWLFFLLESTINKHVQLEISGMYNVDPGPASPIDNISNEFLKILYPSVGCTFTYGNRRMNIRYVKQVEGVICTGGICRLEPAFSGIRINTYAQF